MSPRLWLHDGLCRGNGACRSKIQKLCTPQQFAAFAKELKDAPQETPDTKKSIYLGAVATMEKTFTEEDIQQFAKLTGDYGNYIQMPHLLQNMDLVVLSSTAF